MGFWNTLFGGGAQNEKTKEMLASGAIIIDVRTAGEFNFGNVPGSKNLPLQSMANQVKSIKKMGKPIVLCCATGNRSGQAASFLQSKGVECINGGGWRRVNKLI